MSRIILRDPAKQAAFEKDGYVRLALLEDWEATKHSFGFFEAYQPDPTGTSRQGVGRYHYNQSLFVS